MKKLLNKIILNRSLAFLFYTSVFIPAAFAQAVPPINVKMPDLFSGYSSDLIQAPEVSPYGVVNGENIIPMVVGYGLLNVSADNNDTYNTPYIPQNKTPSSNAPLIQANTPTQLVLGQMLQTSLSEDAIKNYAKTISDNLDAMDNAALVPVSSSSSYNSTANVPDNSALTVGINQNYANPYDAKSLFDYIAPQKPNLNGKVNPAEVYISLASGALTPVPTPSPLSDDFSNQIRRLAAIQTGGVNALQQIFDRSKPTLNDSDAENLKNTLQALGDASLNKSPNSKRDFEQIMATHRLDPNNGWYTHLQQATPIELQRQQLYLEAEMLYELHQIRQEEEQNKLLLALALLGQNYQNRAALNFTAKISPSAIKSMMSNAPGISATS